MSGWKDFPCRFCGGQLYFNDDTNQTGHSVPACAEYMKLCEKAEVAGFYEVSADGKHKKLPSE